MPAIEDGKIYLGDRLIKEWGEVPLEGEEQVWLLYGDEIEPAGEVVHKDEFALRTEQPNKDRQGLFVNSIQGFQSKVLKNLISHNLNWNDVRSATDWVLEAVGKVGHELNNRLFKVDNWQTELRPSHALSKLHELGVTPKFPEDMNEAEKYVMNAVIAGDPKFEEIMKGFPSILSLKKVVDAIADLQTQAIEAFAGCTQDRFRMQTMEEMIHKLREDETPKDTEDGSGDVKSDPDEAEALEQPAEQAAVSNGEDAASGEGEPKSEGGNSQ